MSIIHATVRKGRIETVLPHDIPEGTQLTIEYVKEATAPDCEANWKDTPDAVESWLQWYDSLEPLEWTEAEREEFFADRQKRKKWEIEHFFERAELVGRHWQ
jgi:hypothetical protein